MMMNSELVEQQTLAMAQRLLTVPSVDDRIFAAFDSALNRKPNASEIETGRQYVLQAQRVASTTQQESDDAQLQAWQSYCRVLLSSNEFAYVE